MEKNEQVNARNQGMNRPGSFVMLLLIVLYSGGCGIISSTIFYKDPLTATEHNNLGVAYEREGKNDLAEKQYKRAIQKDDRFTSAYVNLGNVYYDKEDYDKAEKYYKKALKLDPENIMATNNLGNVYLKNNEYDQGIELLSGLLDTTDEIPAFYLDTLARLYLGKGNRTKTISLLRSACKRAGDDTELIDSIDQLLKDLQGGDCKVKGN